MFRVHEKVIVIPDAFSKEECEDLIVRLDEMAEFRPGGVYRRVGDEDYEKIVDEKIRKAREWQVPFDQFDDMRSRLRKLGQQVNDEHYQFNIGDVPYDRTLYVVYEQGGYFGRHKDALGDSELGYKKLAMTLQLSSNEDFTGGDLIIDSHGSQPKGQGTVIVFPVYMMHEVAGVNGTRKIVVNWCTSSTPFR